MGAHSSLCITCKGGKMLCGLKNCPLLGKINIAPKISEKMNSPSFFGPSTSVFIGHNNYPNVFVGAVGAVGEEEKIDSPASWFGLEYSKIIEMRAMSLRTKYLHNIRSKSRITEDNKLIALSKKPVDVELNFRGKPTSDFSFSDITNPFGASAWLQKMKITENPTIPHKVEKVINDELKSTEQIRILSKDFDNYYLTSILSSGSLGLKDKQKMVPTRWSITAIDDRLARDLLIKIKEYKEVETFTVYESEFLGNRFVILLIPGKWEYENFEAWSPGSFWSFDAKEVQIVEEYEPFQGRTNYADKEGGGYYASRLGVVEGLEGLKRQARVIVFREIGKEYILPVGVWQCRQNVRNAFNNEAKKFTTIKEALDHCSERIHYGIDKYLKISNIMKQSRIQDFSNNNLF